MDWDYSEVIGFRGFGKDKMQIKKGVWELEGQEIKGRVWDLIRRGEVLRKFS